jgi:hypothetical protein
MKKTNFATRIINHESNYSSDVWTKVERELDQKRKRRIFLFVLLGLAFMSSIGLGNYYLSQQKVEIMSKHNLDSKNHLDPINDIPKP